MHGRCRVLEQFPDGLNILIKPNPIPNSRIFSESRCQSNEIKRILVKFSHCTLVLFLTWSVCFSRHSLNSLKKIGNTEKFEIVQGYSPQNWKRVNKN